MTDLRGRLSRCKSCNAEVFWVETESGKRMPCNAKPKRKDLVLCKRQGKTIAKMADVYESHFATCPNAKQRRRRRSSREEKALAHDALVEMVGAEDAMILGADW